MRRVQLTPVQRAAAGLALLALSLLGIGIANAAGMPLTSGHVWAGKTSLTKATCNESSVATTYVDESSANSVVGGGTTISTQTNNKNRQYAFIRFDLSGCGIPTSGGADSAILSLSVTSASRSNHTISVYPVYSGWSPGSLTWNSAQSLTVGSTATGTFTAATGAVTITVTADLDSAIKAGTLWGWELVDTGGPGQNTTTIASSSYPTSSYRPALALSYEK